MSPPRSRAPDDLLTGRVAHVRALLDAADQRFVDLYVRAQPADWALAVNVGHVLADQRGHAPRGLVGYAKLEFAVPWPKRREQVDRVEPELERRAGLLKGRAHGRMWV